MWFQHGEQTNMAFFADDKFLRVYTHVCFGRMCHAPAKNCNRAEIYFIDQTSKHTKSTVLTDSYLSKLQELGLFRNCTIHTDIEPHFKLAYRTVKQRIVTLVCNPQTISAIEVFLLGIMLRHIASCHRVLDDFIKIAALNPEIDPVQLMIIAENTTYKKVRTYVYEPRQHNISMFCSTIFTGKTLVDFHKLCDKSARWINASRYTPKDGLGIYFIQYTIPTDIKLKHADGTEYNKHVCRDVSKSKGYTKELIESFYNKELFFKKYGGL